MSTTDDAEASVSSELPVGNPHEVAKNPTALKEAYKEMAIIDVLVCGSCHNVFHFIKDFEEHKEQEGCTGDSPIKDINEREAQIWAFLLWKCSSSGETGHNNSWRLYQQWCRMPVTHRNAWITAGTNVLSTSKYAHATLTELTVPDDQLVPIQVAAEKKRGRPKKHKLDDSDTAHRSGEESDVISSPMKKPNIMNKSLVASNLQKLRYDDSIRNAQERVPPEERVARRTERGDLADAGEFIVEKILAKRFNPRTKQYEYLLKWEGYPHEQNTWEPVENMDTCKNLLQAFEKQLARQKELKALRAQLESQGGPTPVKVKQALTPAVKLKKEVPTPTYTPTGRLQRSSKARALDQVKAWCGATDDESTTSKKFKKEITSDDEDYTDSEGSKEDSPVRSIKQEKKPINGSPKSNVDPELVKKLGLGGKGMPNIKGVIKVDPKQIPNLSSGVYIMSKSSGIIKIDSPGKPGTSIDQDTIRKQIMAAKQRKSENELKPTNKTPLTPAKKSGLLGQQVTEKTIITPSGQRIIQRTIQKTNTSPNTKSPVSTLLNKKLGISNDSLLRRGGGARGRGRGAPSGYSITTASGNIIRVREKNADTTYYESDGASSDSSDGISDPFPSSSEPIPPDSPSRDLTLCPLTGRRLARAEGEPTPPPTPSPPPTPPSPAPAPVMMKVEMSPGGTTGMLVAGDAPSLPVLTDEEGSEVKVEASAVKQLLEDGVDEGEEVNLLQGDNTPIMIRGEDGVLYQVTGENEAGQTVLVPAEGVETGADGEEVMYVTREDSSDVLSLDPAQLAALLPGGGGGALQQVTVQVEGEPGEDATQVIAQLVHADLPSPGGTRRVVLLLPDGSLTMTDLDKEQYESITEATAQE